MKEGKLKIGVKGIPGVVIPVDDPENIDDLSTLSNNDASVVVRWARRGLNIERQERSGARDLFRDLHGKDTPEDEVLAQVTDKVRSFDPTAIRERASSGPRVKNVTVKKQKTYTAAQMAEALASQGVNVEFGDDE